MRQSSGFPARGRVAPAAAFKSNLPKSCIINCVVSTLIPRIISKIKQAWVFVKGWVQETWTYIFDALLGEGLLNDYQCWFFYIDQWFNFRFLLVFRPAKCGTHLHQQEDFTIIKPLVNCKGPATACRSGAQCSWPMNWRKKVEGGSTLGQLI